MGTRGTLRIYLNGELKVRQYNQWDSYPTGQFDTICNIMSSEFIVRSIVSKLAHSRIATKDEMLKLRETKAEDLKDIWLHALLDRDIGSDILILLAGAPHACEVIPDWYYAFSDYETEEDLPGEEGNYVIHFECGYKENSFIKVIDSKTVRFKLSGEWHGATREFDWNYIPTKEEMKAWEEEPYSE